MPGQRDLLGGGEVARTEVSIELLPDKGRFGQVHLPGNGQHGFVAEVSTIEEHGTGVAAQGEGGEGIDLVEGVGGHVDSFHPNYKIKVLRDWLFSEDGQDRVEKSEYLPIR